MVKDGHGREAQAFHAYYCKKCAKYKTGKCRERVYVRWDGTWACRAYRCAAID